MHNDRTTNPDVERDTVAFYRCVLAALTDASLPFLVGGSHALMRYTGIERHTKDLDIFAMESDVEGMLATLASHGFAADITYPHWLAKVSLGDDVVDIIYRSGNGVADVDREWFTHAPAATVLGMPVRLVPPEEMLVSKAFVMERERYDGADIAHILRAIAGELDWRRLLRRFGPHWRVLLSHLVLFGYIYPSERDGVPAWVHKLLVRRLAAETQTAGSARVCAGTLLSRAQYLHDIDVLGYADARTDPSVAMTPEDIAAWTAAIDEEWSHGSASNEDPAGGSR